MLEINMSLWALTISYYLFLFFCFVFSGWSGIIFSMVSFLFFTDMCIYWIHRFLHHKLIYKVFKIYDNARGNFDLTVGKKFE